MHDLQLLRPAAVLAVFTLCVVLLLPLRRLSALHAGAVTEDDFKLGESLRVPSQVSLPNRNLMNLLELPLLFYVASLMVFMTGKGGAWFVMLAWLYVGLRVVHSIIHLTCNRVRYRALVFAASNLVLVIIWARILAWLW